MQYTVIIAEDEPLALKTVCSIIEKKCPNFRIAATAADGQDALDKIRRLKPDLVISDIKMPLMTGVEIAEILHREIPDILVLIISGYAEFEYAQSAIRSGVSDYLLKPIYPDVLNDSLSRALADVVKESSEDPIAQIGTYIEQHFAEELSLQGMSERFYLSREYISRRFKQQYGVNLSEYVLTIRMNEAKRLLETSRQRIYEVAQAVGFSDDKYFRKVFKKQVGVTPNEFREQVQRQA